MNESLIGTVLLAAAGPSAVDKSSCDPLPSPVRRVFYLSREGTGQEHEVSPPPNPRVLTVSREGMVVCHMAHQQLPGSCCSMCAI